jgi:hypothetical protein
MKNNENSRENNHSGLNESMIKDALADSGKNIKQFSSQLTEELCQYLEGKKGDISGIRSKFKSTIKENPFLAITAALGIGALFGMIYRK